MNEEKLNKELEVYRKLGQGDEKIDVAGLMLSALEKHQSNQLPPSQKRWAYFISVCFPPFGLLFAIKFFLSDKDDSNDAAWVCIVLTVVSILVLVITAKIIISGSGLDANQLQQLNPQTIQEIIE
ncbi:MAG TPA: hypothetical protein VD998_03295 [Verrucomicrobiae bacterium]|nr:hypothetical protein [Verrucomicrobiae bacterium]